MSGNPTALKTLAGYAKIPVERFKYVPDADADTIREIRDGILFLMAFWSGPSVQAFVRLTEVFAQLDTRRLEFVVVDVDGSMQLSEVPELKGKVTGSGETAWVHRGQIIATSGIGMNIESFKPNTSTLIAIANWQDDLERLTPSDIAKTFCWLAPWQASGEFSESLENELAREVAPSHSLYRVARRAIGRRNDCDDVLFALADETIPLAVVHLTWAGRTEVDPTFPSLQIYNSWQDWVDNRLLPDYRGHRERPV
jgi:hypothetical protein